MKIKIVLIILLFAAAGCGKNDQSISGVINQEVVNAGSNAAETESNGYMDKKSWELAQAELKTIDEVVKVFNGFYDIWGRAYEHRTFLRFREALETVEYLPGKIDEVEKTAAGIKTVPGYPEIDNIKQCYLTMIPLLRSGAENLKLSIIAARDKNEPEERKQVKAYTIKWKQAMDYSKKSFAIMQEILTRGSRTEYQKMTGVNKTSAATAGNLQAGVRKIYAAYDSSVMIKIKEIKKLTAGYQWDAALVKIDDVYSQLQSSVMEAGQLDPGNKKELWDTRQELVTMLSQQMIAMKKYREYTEKLKSGNLQDAAQAGKVYEILKKSADESHSKLRKMGY